MYTAYKVIHKELQENGKYKMKESINCTTYERGMAIFLDLVNYKTRKYELLSAHSITLSEDGKTLATFQIR